MPRGPHPRHDHLPLLRQGLTVTEVARRLGIRRSTIYERLKAQSPELLAEIRAARRSGRAAKEAERKANRKPRGGKPKVDPEQIAADYLAGFAVAEILARHGYKPGNYKVVYRALRKSGVKSCRRPDMAAKFAPK